MMRSPGNELDLDKIALIKEMLEKSVEIEAEVPTQEKETERYIYG